MGNFAVDFKAVVEEASNLIEERLRERRVLVLLPPGNSRLAVAEALCKRLNGVKLFAYKPVDGCEAAEVDAGEVYKHAKGGGAAVVVPRDFTEAKELLKKLDEKQVVNVFLPALYEEALKKQEKGEVKVEDWQRADYSFAEEDGVELWPGARGVHLSLLREGLDAERVKRLKALWEVPEGLLHKAAGVGRAVLEEGFRAALEALAESAFAALFGPVGGAAQLLVSTAKRLVYRGGDAVLQHLRVEDAAARIVKWLLAVRDAGEKYEAPLCEAAARIGARCDDLKKAALSAESLKNEIEKEVQKALETLRDEVEKVRQRLQIVEKIQQPIYRGSIPDVVAEGGVYRLKWEGARLVLEGGFGDFAEKVLEELRRGVPVVLRGPRGAGKTTLALLVAQKWVEEGRPVLRLVNFDDRALSETYKNLDGEFLVLADPSPLEVYRKVATTEEGLPVLETRPLRLNAETVARLLRNAVERKVPTLLALTEEEYEEFAKLRDRPNHVVVTIPTFEEKFYRRLIEEYGGEKAKQLSPEELKDLVNEVVKYKAGTALVAKYVGVALAKKDVKSAKEALKEGMGDAKRFIKAVLRELLELNRPGIKETLQKIYKIKKQAVLDNLGMKNVLSQPVGRTSILKDVDKTTVIVDDYVTMYDAMLPYRVCAKQSDVTLRYVFTPEFVKELAFALDKVEISQAAANIIARINEDLVEETLQEQLEDGVVDVEDVVDIFANELARDVDKKVLGLALLGYNAVDNLTLDDSKVRLAVVGCAITPGFIWLTHQAIRSRKPLVDPEESCQKLPEKLEERKRVLDLAVWTAYAYSALAGGVHSADCLERALYALYWSLLHVGPLADPALETIFTALDRVGAVEGAPQALWMILNRFGERPGVCEKALPLLDKLYQGAEGRGQAYLTFLVEAYAAVAYRCNDEDAARRAEELLEKLDNQWQMLAAEAYYYLAHWYLSKGQLDKAEESVDKLKKSAGELTGVKGEVAREYFRWRDLRLPEEAIRYHTKVRLSATAELKGRINLEKYVRGVEEKLDAEAFKIAAKAYKRRYDRYKLSDDYVNYIIVRVKYGRALFFAGRYTKALQVFKKAWRKASEELWPRASYLEVAANALVHYAAALIYKGRVEKAKKLLEKYRSLLLSQSRDYAAFYLWSKALGVDVLEEPPDLNSVLLDAVYDFALPAIRYLLTGEHDAKACAEVCRQDLQCSDVCESLLKAAVVVQRVRGGDVIKNVEGKYRSVEGVLRSLGVFAMDFRILGELDGRGLVEVFAPRNTLGQMLFLFRALARGDLKLAKAHALWGALITPRPFAEAYNALKEASTVEEARRNPKYKTALTKLLLRHV